MQRRSSGLASAWAGGALLLLLLAAQAPRAAEAIGAAQAKNLTRVLYLHNYPTMLFYKSMYNVRSVRAIDLGRSVGRARWEQPPPVPLPTPQHPQNRRCSRRARPTSGTSS